MVMRIGLTLPQGESADLRGDVVAVARAAEAAGYASLWVYERALFPLSPRNGMYGVPGLPWADIYRYTAEPLTVLAMAAAVTDTVGLGTSVLVAGLHAPHELARTFATLDQATGGGRVTVGLGTGWSEDEFLAAGADFERRGVLLDETMDALGALWGPDPVTYGDSRMRVDNALVSPKPVAPVPVLVGGGTSAKALDRIARRADGWLPTGIPTEVMGGQWQKLRAMAAEHGRPADALRLVPLLHLSITAAPLGADRLPFCGSVSQVVSDVAEVAAIGAHEAVIALHGLTSNADHITQSVALIEELTVAGLRD